LQGVVVVAVRLIMELTVLVEVVLADTERAQEHRAVAQVQKPL
jgi:hypothetical protein